MDENQPIQQPTPETPAGGSKSKAGMWIAVVVVIIVAAVVIWQVVK
ncbi:MAG: hypothetical protein WCV50_02745 [Patescibacteria group bacterium]|jgi:hypothetical protein